MYLIRNFIALPGLSVKIAFVLLLLSLSSGCGLQLISGYDEASKKDMLALAREVDAFYIDILDEEPERREYQYYADDYRYVLVELNALRRSQEIRQYNELTLKQVDILLDLWKKDMAQHKKNDGFSTFLLKRHRDQYVRIFAAMIKGEAAKAMATPAPQS